MSITLTGGFARLLLRVLCFCLDGGDVLGPDFGYALALARRGLRPRLCLFLSAPGKLEESLVRIRRSAAQRGTRQIMLWLSTSELQSLGDLERFAAPPEAGGTRDIPLQIHAARRSEGYGRQTLGLLLLA